MVCPLAVAFGQVALDVAILVQRTSLVNEFLAVSALECLDDPAGSSLNFPVKSPYGSPRSVKLLIPSTCLAGEARCEAPRLS